MSKARLVLLLLLLPVPLTPGQAPGPKPAGKLAPFLNDFKAIKEPSLLAIEVKIATAVGPVAGFLARPDTREKLPAVMLLHDRAGLTGWMKDNARELCSIGYVVLALDLEQGLSGKEADEEKTLAEMSAAVRWLRRRPDVFAGQIGLAGWGWGGGQALLLASATAVQGCVVCDSSITADPATLAGLRGTPILGVFSSRNKEAARSLPGFRKALREMAIPHQIFVCDGVAPGFMGPAGNKAYSEKEAERAWFEIYEFLGKHVEDAGSGRPGPVPVPAKAVASIADIMRAINQPTGIRGALSKSLEEKPASAREWKQVRSRAALLAEAGNLLQNLRPPRGSLARWKEHTRAYRQTAVAMVAAADRRDYPAMQKGLAELGQQCASCHQQHR